MSARRIGAALVAAAALAVGGCSATGDAGAAADQHSGHGSEPDVEPDADGPSAPTAVDVGFAQDMSTHHDQAVSMSRLAVTRGTPAVRQIGLGILYAQAQETGAMRGWLRVWGEPVVSEAPMAWMHDAGHEHDTGTTGAPMPGMATADDLLDLSALGGTRFDVRFLQLMIRHHLGGIEMGRAAIEGDTSPLVREAARQMVAEQVTDLGPMRSLLAADGGRELPFAPAG